MHRIRSWLIFTCMPHDDFATQPLLTACHMTSLTRGKKSLNWITSSHSMGTGWPISYWGGYSSIHRTKPFLNLTLRLHLDLDSLSAAFLPAKCLLFCDTDMLKKCLRGKSVKLNWNQTESWMNPSFGELAERIEVVGCTVWKNEKKRKPPRPPRDPPLRELSADHPLATH